MRVGSAGDRRVCVSRGCEPYDADGPRSSGPSANAGIGHRHCQGAAGRLADADLRRHQANEADRRVPGAGRPRAATARSRADRKEKEIQAEKEQKTI